MAHVYFAWMPAGHDSCARWCEENGGSLRLLVAYPFLEAFNKLRGAYRIDALMLDSGAFSAHNKGEVIDIEAFADAARSDEFDEVFGLDVIGDPVGTRRNLEWLWEHDVPAIPTFHFGSPASALDWALDHAPGPHGKIALGGIARTKKGQTTIDWLRWCLGRSYPRRVHVFGRTGNDVLSIGPWDSCDSTSWRIGPSIYGRWEGFCERGAMHVPRTPRTEPVVNDFRTEIRFFQQRERWSEATWAPQLDTVRSHVPERLTTC